MKQVPFYVLLVILTLTACKKESGSDGNPANTNAVFSPVSAGGACSGATVQGTYSSGNSLGLTHGVTLQVNVTSPGNYFITTPTVNGYKFSASGTFTSTGSQTISLAATGSPVAGGTDLFPITVGNNSCSFSVTVGGIPPITYVDNDHMLFGNPSNAAPVTDSANNYLMRRTHYALSYSRDRGIANWVSWHLFAPHLGSTPRQDDFRPDATLPAGWYQVQSNSFSGSGFDRGHNVPSGDRTASVEANSSTFLMTNMIPQAPNHNQVTWARMEDSLRALVNAGNELYIIMGSYGAGGTGSSGFATTIDAGRVTVPASIWKVAVVIPNGNGDSARVNANTRVIAVNIPNSNTVNGNWKTYRVSIDAIETATGYDLLNRLSTSLQAVIEARVDNF